MNKINWQKTVITLFRMAIGWHFLFEGFVKICDGDWSAVNYLAGANGPFSSFYHWLASSEGIIRVIDIINMSGLLLIGLGLFVGIAIKALSVSGIALLLLYYFAYPPFGGSLLTSVEGNYYIIDKNFIEILALAVLLLIKEKGYGIYNLRQALRRKISIAGSPGKNEYEHSRREALKNLAVLPALGIMGWGALKEVSRYGVDTLSGATATFDTAGLSDLKGELPMGKLGRHEIGRLILGGNLIGAWAHARDLIYVNSLFRAYNTEKKIFETLMLAEKAGINCINISFVTNETLAKYKRITGSKIKVISQVPPDMKNNDYFVNINKAIDYGADIIQIQGNWCDWLVRDNKTDVIGKMIDNIRSQDYVAGLGAHTVDSLITCEKQGIIPDYYMKAMHHDNYWSAHPRENRVPFEVDGKKFPDHDRFHDNIFCLFPDRTTAFVEKSGVPVMGFKVLAAGAIPPENGFKWAFYKGADFICVGMFDFQIVDDVNITIEILKNRIDRKREWYA